MTQNWYDWRDRLIATKQGVQASEDTVTHRPLTYITYDNLGEKIKIQQYDSDGVNVLRSSNGVPQPPTGLLRAQTVKVYDEVGQLYRTQMFGVDPVSGVATTSALTTNTFYDLRGQVIAQYNPGGLVNKTQYDAVGRGIVSYATDGAGGMTWTTANSVGADNVLQQTNRAFDNDGNAILVTTRQRFDNETQLGALGDPNTGPKRASPMSPPTMTQPIGLSPPPMWVPMAARHGCVPTRWQLLPTPSW